jgi:5-methyltetrahydrofolate--homocysteine methyltransferase
VRRCDPKPNNDNNQATEALINFAETVKAKGKVTVKDEAWRNENVEKRIAHSLVNGITDYVEADTKKHAKNIQNRLM